MKRLFPVVTVLAAVALAGFAPRASMAAGVNLGWSDCGPAGQVDRTFACGTNAGTNLMVGSFDPPVPLTQVVAIEAVVDLISQSLTLPDWWKVKNPPGKLGFCRNGALTGNADFTGGPFTCVDLFAGGASGGIGAMLYPFPANPNLTTGSFADSLRWARINMVYAIPQPGPTLAVDPGIQYYAFKLSVSNAKSTGVGSCAGCAEPVCIVLNQIRLSQPLGVGNFDVTTPIAGQTRTITWQGGPGQSTCDLVPTRRATWGQIKSLYR
jgi:hypothetical protein